MSERSTPDSPRFVSTQSSSHGSPSPDDGRGRSSACSTYTSNSVVSSVPGENEDGDKAANKDQMNTLKESGPSSGESCTRRKRLYICPPVDVGGYDQPNRCVNCVDLPKESDSLGKYIDTRIYMVPDDCIRRLTIKDYLKPSGLDIKILTKPSGKRLLIDINRIPDQGIGAPVFRCPWGSCLFSTSVRLQIKNHVDSDHGSGLPRGMGPFGHVSCARGEPYDKIADVLRRSESTDTWLAGSSADKAEVVDCCDLLPFESNAEHVKIQEAHDSLETDHQNHDTLETPKLDQDGKQVVPSKSSWKPQPVHPKSNNVPSTRVSSQASLSDSTSDQSFQWSQRSGTSGPCSESSISQHGAERLQQSRKFPGRHAQNNKQKSAGRWFSSPPKVGQPALAHVMSSSRRAGLHGPNFVDDTKSRKTPCRNHSIDTRTRGFGDTDDDTNGCIASALDTSGHRNLDSWWRRG